MFRLALLAMVAAVQLRAGDPRFGTWKLIDAHSVVDPPRKLTVTMRQDTIHVAISGDEPMEFTAKWDGHGYPVSGVLAFDQIVVHRIGRTRVDLIEKKAGILVATVREQLSPDGKELEATTSRTGHDDQISVLERTGGIPDAKNPFAGEWTEDPGKSLLRQGLVLKIAPDGQDGVHYSGDSRYDAKLDGKDYAVTNSRDDTVALKLIDAHTVESIYKRDGQVTDRDRWVVSNDGQQLSVTTTGTSETGGHIREDLVFRKQ
jgi:hypothetical protein